MTRVRQLLFPLWYVGVRLAARPGRIALAVAGISAAAALLAGVLAGALVAQDRALGERLARLPATERGLRASWFGAPRQGAQYGTLGRAVEGAFADLGAGEPVRAMRYKQTRVGGKLVDLGAAEGLERWVRLRSGRLPGPCRPELCEVVQLGGSGPIPNVPGLRLVRVGRGTLASEVPFGRLAPAGGLVETVGARFAVQTRAPPFLVADGVAGLARAPELASIFRSYTWFAPLEPGAVRPWQVDRYAAAVARTRSRLKTASFLFDLTAPVEPLQAAAGSGRASARRVLLLGGEAAALVLAFVVLAAAGLRRALEADLRRMSWYGASGWQLALRSAGEAAVLGLGATALGWALGTGVAFALAERAGSPGGAVARHSILSGQGLLLASFLGVAAAATLLAALRARPRRLGAFSISAVDVAALGALAAVSVGLVRGEAGAGQLAEDEGAGAFLVALPALVTFAAAVVIVRATPPLCRLLERLARRRSPGLRFAALSLARSPGPAAVVAAFLAASLALAFFAAAYRATLERSEVDQARFAVPLDFTLREDLGKLVPPLELAPLSRYERLGDGVDAVPVVRLSASVSRLETSRGVTVLGLPAGEVASLPGWRSDFAAVPPTELASRIGALGAVALRGPRIPADARELRLRARANGDDVVLVASIAGRAGRFLHLELGTTRGERSAVLRAALPAAARGGRVVALTVGLTDLSRETGEPLEGVLSLGQLTAEGGSGRTVVTDYRGWVGAKGLERTGGCCATTLRYFVTNQVTSRFRPPQATDRRPIPVIASRALARAAGPGSVLPIERIGQQLSVRVVAVARRFPSVEGEFVVAEIGALRTALDADQPGSAPVGEIWLRVPPAGATRAEATLRKPPFDVLRVESRRALERELRADPLARATLATLVAAAVAGLLLALLGVFLAVASDLRDERSELFDLETEGAEPRMLRRHVHLRAFLTAAVGLLGGIGLGAALAALTVEVVRLTAAAARPEPPLLLEFDWRLVATATGAYLAAATVLVATLTWSWFRARTPARPTPEPA